MLWGSKGAQLTRSETVGEVHRNVTLYAAV